MMVTPPKIFCSQHGDAYLPIGCEHCRNAMATAKVIGVYVGVIDGAQVREHGTPRRNL